MREFPGVSVALPSRWQRRRFSALPKEALAWTSHCVLTACHSRAEPPRGTAPVGGWWAARRTSRSRRRPASHMQARLCASVARERRYIAPCRQTPAHAPIRWKTPPDRLSRARRSTRPSWTDERSEQKIPPDADRRPARRDGRPRTSSVFTRARCIGTAGRTPRYGFRPAGRALQKHSSESPWLRVNGARHVRRPTTQNDRPQKSASASVERGVTGSGQAKRENVSGRRARGASEPSSRGGYHPYPLSTSTAVGRTR